MPGMATHPEPPDERCYYPECSATATHKVGEQAPLYAHEMTTYLCCEHMQAIAMNCEWYRYDVALTNPFPPESTPDERRRGS
jgi:hypothetical protein